MISGIAVTFGIPLVDLCDLKFFNRLQRNSNNFKTDKSKDRKGRQLPEYLIYTKFSLTATASNSHTVPIPKCNFQGKKRTSIY